MPAKCLPRTSLAFVGEEINHQKKYFVNQNKQNLGFDFLKIQRGVKTE